MRLLNIFYILNILFTIGCSNYAKVEKIKYSAASFREVVNHGVMFLNKYDVGDMEALDRARANFEIARELDRSSPLSFDGLACVAVRENNLSLARILLKQVLKLDPDYSRGYANLAYIEQIEGNNTKAEYLLRKSVELNSLDSHAANNLGSLLFNTSIGNPILSNEGRNLIYRAREIHKGESELIDKNVMIVQDSKN